MKEGHALCIGCGRHPEKKEIPKQNQLEETPLSIEKTLEKKMDMLTKELEHEEDHEKQQNILKTINSLLETMEKIKKKQ